MATKATEILSDEAVDELLGGAATPVRSKIEQAVADLQAIVDADKRKLFKEGSMELLSPSQWPDEHAKAVQDISVSNNGTINVRFHDRARIQEQLNKLQGLYSANETSENPLEDILREIPRDTLKNILLCLRELGTFNPDAAADDA